jgi:hypothetical protein
MMEKLKGNYNLRPLPGGYRRGTPGAGAGCFSMRTVGGEELNKRALAGNVPEYTTAEPHNFHLSSPSSSNLSLFDSPGSSPKSYGTVIASNSSSNSSTLRSNTPMAADVVQLANAIVTAPTASQTRARKRWTEMNKFIWRTYLIVTELEQNTKGYLDKLHQHFTQAYPHMLATKQRLGDQRRAIVNKKLISDTVLNTIKDEVSSHLTSNIHLQTDNTNLNTLPFTQNTNGNNELIRRRIKWTTSMNESIIRNYFKITNLESNRTAYRRPLHLSFITQYPELGHLTEQRISDQLRVIIKNKLLSDAKLNQIKEEIMNERDNLEVEPLTEILNTITNNSDEVDSEELQTTITSLHDNNTCTNNHNTEHSPEITETEQNKIKDTFTKAMENFKSIHPTCRPYIPKQRHSKKLTSIVEFINFNMLPPYLHIEQDFQSTHDVIYCAAYTAVISNGAKLSNNSEPKKQYSLLKPAWQQRLENKIENIRIKIGRLTAYINGNNSRTLVKQIEKIKTQYKIHSKHELENTQLSEFLDTLKQKLNAWSSRLRRYKLTTERKVQNKQFRNNEKAFYRKFTHEQTISNNETNTPTLNELHNFWSNIWSNPIHHNNSSWILQNKSKYEHIPEMDYSNISLDLLIKVIAKTNNWKATGSDKIHNYWYKKLTSTHAVILTHINNFIRDPGSVPSFVTQGITYMLPKDKTDPKNPSKYRPITCLQNIYKILTSCISEIIYKHLETHNILAEQQKGCRKKSQGCKEQLIIDSVVSKLALRTKSDIYTMYIDYQKAFDSVPHSWLVSILKHYNINDIIINFLSNTMQNWTTVLKLQDHQVSNPVNIRRGIFQGDALSPLWFCIALNPLSDMLNDSNGLPIGNLAAPVTLSHLLYMDDIKLYAKSLNDLNVLAKIVERFSTDIKMDFGINKCKIQSVKKGKIEYNNYELNNRDIIEPVDNRDGYKYLGYQQTQQIHQKDTKHNLTQKFKSRLHNILNTHLNARNTIKAINTFAIPILTYSFGIINWTKTDLLRHERTIRTLLTQYRKHHPRSCIQRLTLPKHEGGRGLIDLQNLHNKQIGNLRSYFINQKDRSPLHNAILQADNKLTPLNLCNHNTLINPTIVQPRDKIDIWTQKTLHGRHQLDLSKPEVDKVASNAWLKKGELFPETEGFMLAIQDQVIETNNYKKYIIKDRSITTDLCRRCHRHSETIQHITGACPTIAQSDYKHRHDQVAAIIHQYIAFKLHLIKEKTSYYKYTPQTVHDTPQYKMYWDRTIITDKTLHCNRPDITLHDKINKQVFLIDIAIPNTHNISNTYTEKISKYTDLAIELKTQWKVTSVKTVPIIISSTGVIPHTLHTGLKVLNMHPLTYQLLQKAVILNTCRIVRKFLSME